MDTTTSPERLLISVTDVCEALGGLGRTSVYALIKRGELTKVKIGDRGFVTAESVRAYVDRLTTGLRPAEWCTSRT